VAIMALIAACTLQPGVYLSMNMKGAPPATVEKVTAWGFPVTTTDMDQLAAQSGEKTLFGRTGGAATLAVGMSQIFSNMVRGHGLDLWYHFAIMFEALFILTTLDAGTRVGRYLLQDVLGNVWGPLGDTKNVAANVAASGFIVAAWGYFLIQGVRDPLGGINSLWPLFGIANQLLAAIALCLGVTIVLKMQLQFKGQNAKFKMGKPLFALAVFIPLVWLLTVTMTAGYQKIFHEDPRIGFLASAKALDGKLPDLQTAVSAAEGANVTTALAAAQKAVTVNRTLHFNNILDAIVAAFFMAMVVLIVVISVWEWISLLVGKGAVKLHESEAVWLPEYAVKESQAVNVASMVALGCALAKELSGETHFERAQQMAMNCQCAEGRVGLLSAKRDNCGKTAEQIYVEMTERQFDGVKRCC
jgi:carbon starvation protein